MWAEHAHTDSDVSGALVCVRCCEHTLRSRSHADSFSCGMRNEHHTNEAQKWNVCNHVAEWEELSSGVKSFPDRWLFWFLQRTLWAEPPRLVCMGLKRSVQTNKNAGCCNTFSLPTRRTLTASPWPCSSNSNTPLQRQCGTWQGQFPLIIADWSF